MPRRLPAAELPKLTEKRFQAQVLELATLCGWEHWHDNATNAPRRCTACGAVRRGPRNTAGLPDLLLVRGDRLIWAELKAQDGATSPEQREWIARLRAAGQTCYIWRPSDWPTIEHVLAR
jgi:hypothetical protein